MNLFKKYWTHILSLGFLIFPTIVFLMMKNTMYEEIDVSKIVILFIGIFVFVIGIWVEIIYGMIHAIKHKEIENHGIYAILCYLFNVFYIPCYYLKYVVKDEKYKIKNIIYLVISIVLFMVMSISMFAWAIESDVYSEEYNMENRYDSYMSYNSKDKVVNFKLPNDYVQSELGEYDLFFEDNAGSAIGVYLYEGEEYTADYVLNGQENNILEDIENKKLIDKRNNKIEGKVLKSHIYYIKDKKSEKIYDLSVITFKDKPNYVVFVYCITHKEDYNRIKYDFDFVLKNIKLNH